MQILLSDIEVTKIIAKHFDIEVQKIEMDDENRFSFEADNVVVTKKEFDK